MDLRYALGPILFSIYINGLLELNTVGKISSFADDTVIEYNSDSWDSVKRLAETDFLLLKQWFDHSYLTINFDKTKFMTFSCNKRKETNFHELKIKSPSNQYTIQKSDEIKLGVFFDNHIKWDKHINF